MEKGAKGGGARKGLVSPPPPPFWVRRIFVEKEGRGEGTNGKRSGMPKRGGGGKWPSIHGVERGDARGGEL